MSYSVSDEEKQNAEKLILYFNNSLKLLKSADDYLNVVKTPLKNNTSNNSKELYKSRAALRIFRDQVINNFNKFKQESFKCVKLAQVFMSDTQTAKLIKSFISSIEELQKKANDFVQLFSEIESNDFAKNLIDIIEKIQEKCDNLINLINDRILSHIQNNILSKNWINNISDSLEEKIEENTPLFLDLVNQRQAQLLSILKKC